MVEHAVQLQAAASEDGGELLGRNQELEAVAEGVATACRGDGNVIAIEGAAGIGKTAVLTAARGIARDRGMRVLLATGAPLETAFPFGVARQLFDPVRRELSAEAWADLSSGAARLASLALDERALESPGAGDDPSFATLHGLYWLTSNLAAQAPLMLAIDDAQWADSPSLRFLAHLVPRLDGVPALVVLAVRTGDAPTDTLVLTELLAASKPVLSLRPLDEDETAELVRARLGGTVDASLCAACHRATGGNPFLLRTLTDGFLSGEVPASARAVDSMRGVRLATVVRALLRRLARLPGAAEPVVTATAALGGGASLEEVAELAELDAAAADRAAGALRSAGILADGPALDFVHPLVRAAVYEGMASDERRALHLRAARLLAARGAPAERSAVHYLAIEGDGDPAAVSTLRDAARLASARGAPDLAASYLRRALAEPPTDDERPRVKFALGLAGIAAEEPDSVKHLVEAVHGIPDSRERAEAALEAAIPLSFNGNSLDVISVCDAALTARSSLPPDLVERLEGERAINGFLNASTVPSAVRWVEGAGGCEDSASRPAATLGAAWMRLAMEGRPAHAEVDRLMGMVTSGSLFAEPSGVLAQGAVWVLVLAGRPDVARDVGHAVVAMGEQQGSILFASVGRFWRAVAEFDLCLVADSAADATAAYDVALSGAGDEEGLSYILSSLLDALVEAGELERAEEALVRASRSAGERGPDRETSGGVSLPRDLPARAGFAFLVESRGRLRVAQGRPADGAADLLEAGGRWQELGVVSPVATLWRGEAALALDSLGRSDEARRLASEQLALARRAEEARTLGASLRAAGEIEGGAAGRQLLEEAVAVLEDTPARLELAKALLSLGRALRRARARGSAREPLARALDIAYRGGAGRVAEAAREELRLAGARPRRAELSGAQSLTPAERNVAELAASGSPNREIAQRLFVSLRTVETHLTHAYQKLGITSREELAGALTDEA